MSNETKKFQVGDKVEMIVPQGPMSKAVTRMNERNVMIILDADKNGWELNDGELLVSIQRESDPAQIEVIQSTAVQHLSN